MRQLFLCCILGLTACAGSPEGQPLTNSFDWQGHRGARGLMPENSIPSFLKALEYPIQTLELDVVISKDSQVVVSHEPWLSSTICSTPEGKPVIESEEDNLVIFKMAYADIAQYDCGKRGHKDFPDQVPTPVVKPVLANVVAAVKDYCKMNNREVPFFNIEIKSRPDWDNNKTPEPVLFAQLLIDQIKALEIEEKTCIQSFDPRSLQAVRKIDNSITTAYLIANLKGLDKNLRELGYQPEIYSPNSRLVSGKMVKKAHDIGMKVIPWTVNDLAAMRRLKKMGVDGIITDHPNLIKEM